MIGERPNKNYFESINLTRKANLSRLWRRGKDIMFLFINKTLKLITKNLYVYFYSWEDV